jgi:hypothetical protein
VQYSWGQHALEDASMKLLAFNSKANPLYAILFEFGHDIHHHFVLHGFIGC